MADLLQPVLWSPFRPLALGGKERRGLVQPTADISGPVLTAATITATSDTTADVVVTSDTSGGTASWVVVETALAVGITALQIVAGTDNADDPAAADGQVTDLVATVSSGAEATGLVAETEYVVAWVQSASANPIANVSNVIVSDPDTTEAEGGGDWWPADSKVAIDLLNDRAWTIEDGEVAISALMGTDATAMGGYGSTEYLGADIAEDGYFQSGNPPAFLSRAKTRILAGCTYRIQFLQVATSGATILYLGASSNNANILCDEDSSLALLVFGNDIGEAIGASFTESVVNAMACTLTPTRAEFATNGTLRFANVIGEVDWPTTGPDVLDFALIDGSGSVYIQTITIYEVLPSTAGLATLSTVI